jgi:cystathionine beta-lyase
MELYNFDTALDRTGRDTLKWGKYEGRDILPLWVADMDFKSPPQVAEALRKEIEYGIFGYCHAPRELVSTLLERLQTQYGWKVDPSWISWLPGMVPGLNIACRAIGGPGDDILTTTPIYPPFLSAPKFAGRSALKHEMHWDDESQTWPLDTRALQETLTPATKLFLFCNPHNPLGRIFTKKELEATAEFALRNELVVCSDEIHCELLLKEGRPHIPIASLSPEIASRTITLMAPSKTFNLPGFGCSFAIIPDPELRAAFLRTKAGIVPDPAALGYHATLAAYRDSQDWHEQLIEYLRENARITFERINKMHGLVAHPVEATYLQWVDTTGMDESDPHKFFEDHGVGLSNGQDFGKPRWLRLNFGCPRSTLMTALDRMDAALAS